MPIFGVFTPHEKDCFRKAIGYMETHYRDHISAETLASHAGININLLRKGIFETTGCSVHHYLVKIRIEKAMDDLADFNKSIKWIARKNGFSSSSHFGLEFKKRTGQTPAKFRLSLLISTETSLYK